MNWRQGMEGEAGGGGGTTLARVSVCVDDEGRKSEEKKKERGVGTRRTAGDKATGPDDDGREGEGRGERREAYRKGLDSVGRS